MAKTGLKLDKGWPRLELAFDGRKFPKASRRHLRRATERVGKLALGAVRRGVRKGGFTRRAALTIHISGTGKKPLVDTATRLFQGMTSEVQSDTSVFVGFTLGNPNVNAAAAVHDGATIKVTAKMRNMFRLLWLTSTGQFPSGDLTGRAAELWARQQGGWIPLKASTKIIRIPARPFIKRAFADPKLIASVKVVWERAVQRTLKDQSRKKK